MAFHHGRRRRLVGCAAAIGLLLLPACQDHNQQALILGAPRVVAPQIRAMQTLSLPETNEAQVLIEATQVLLDLGFALDETSSALGVLVGSKQRDATEAGQVAAAIALSVVSALLLVPVQPIWDRDQTIRVNLVTKPLGGARGTELRVTFERRVTTNQGQSRFEALEDPAMYREFLNLMQQNSVAGGRT